MLFGGDKNKILSGKTLMRNHGEFNKSQITYTLYKRFRQVSPLDVGCTKWIRKDDHYEDNNPEKNVIRLEKGRRIRNFWKLRNEEISVN